MLKVEDADEEAMGERNVVFLLKLWRFREEELVEHVQGYAVVVVEVKAMNQNRDQERIYNP
jgi:hypothetical protein